MPVGLDCNLACRYCYHGIFSSKIESAPLMTNKILRKIIEGAAEISMDASFLWHGGEALLAELSHFQEAVAIQKQVTFLGRVINILQSNMTLMTKKKAVFFSENDFHVSTSLDGSKKSHDSNRIFRNGCGSHKNVLKAVSIFNDLNYTIGSICLITKSNVGDPDGTYHAMFNSGVTSFSYHICSQDEDRSIDAIPSQAEVVRFTKRMFDLWFEDDNPDFKIRNFRNVIRGLCGGHPLECSSKIGICRAFIAFDSNGDVYPCHRFVGRKQFIIGNVLKKPLKEIFTSPSSLDIYGEMAVIPKKCQRCQWLNVCGTGCPFERLVENGSFNSVGVDCGIKQPLFAHIKERTKNLI